MTPLLKEFFQTPREHYAIAIAAEITSIKDHDLFLLDERVESFSALLASLKNDHIFSPHTSISLHLPLSLSIHHQQRWDYCSRTYSAKEQINHPFPFQVFHHQYFSLHEHSSGYYHLLHLHQHPEKLHLESAFHLYGQETSLHFQAIHLMPSHTNQSIYSQISCHDQAQKVQQITRAIVGKHGKGMFEGKMLLKPQASQSEVHQKTFCTLLDEKSSFQIHPHMLIETGDVTCTHGACYGQFLEEEIFYLQSRGLSPLQAQKLVTYGPLQEMLQTIPDEPTRQLWQHQCMESLEQLLTTSSQIPQTGDS
jgi:hypothetical protein